MSIKSCNSADTEIGKRIRLLRKAKGASQTTAGRVLGISFQQLQKYEKGVNRIPAGRLKLFADWFGVSINELYGEAGTPAPQDLGEAELLGLYRELQDPRVRTLALETLRCITLATRRQDA